MSIAVVGAQSALGARVTRHLEAGGAEALSVAHDGVFDGADCIVHLLAGDHDALVARCLSAVRVTADVLTGATRDGVKHLVMLSSAMVYGAWPGNPVPLTEESAVRPPQDFDFALQLAQAETMVEQWRTEQRGRTVCMLRPALTLAADGSSSIVRALAAGMGLQLDDEDAPAQFLHHDDCASAVVLGATQRLDGVFNVAPDHWVSGPRVRALSGRTPRLRLPSRISEPLVAWRWRFQRGPIPPGLRPYVRFPWLVANDRLCAAGWRPQVTNEQAYVEGTEERWWTMLTPKRKQELSLGAVALIGVAAVVAAARAISRARWRQRRG